MMKRKMIHLLHLQEENNKDSNTMANLNRTRRSFIRQVIEDNTKETRTGKVKRVYEHTLNSDSSNFEADVSVDGGERLERIAPVSTSGPGVIDVPRVGDSVVIEYIAGESPRPIITGFVSTTADRPALGKAGMRRTRLQSDNSPMGNGDVYTTLYSSPDGDTRKVNKNQSTPEDVFVQIAKRSNDVADPSEEGKLPAKVEFFDSPKQDEAYIEASLNVLDGSATDTTWGFKINAKTGSVKLVDGTGHGLVSDGDGNWTWEYKSKTENKVSGGGSLSL